MKANTPNTSKNLLWGVVGALSLVVAGGVAHADAAVDVPVRLVHYSDLDLNSQAGVAALYQRIHNAAELLCTNSDLRQLEQYAAAKACVDHAVSVSVGSVNNAKLSAEYAAHGGEVPKSISLASAR